LQLFWHYPLAFNQLLRYIIKFGRFANVPGKEDQLCEIYYSGRVQGVGFRYTVRSIAASHRVTGFVRNLPDGRVHLIAEGDKAEVGKFIDSIQAEMGTYVHNTQVSVREATGRFKGFEIRF
jgi:acylphosphatase